ncbi:MAG: hypothetical protein LC796_05350 [Acidobacteria bacterium]|nr:hypothetical protein [Acidobacteriota bacterium]MCA1611404.1 hypothetical protein [Acidobacteriota bacterium]
MSLIDEALKRAREQTTNPGDPAAPAPSPSTEDQWAYAPLPERRRARPAVRTLAALAGAVAALAAAVWILRSPRREPIPSSAPGEAPAAAVSLPRSTGTPAAATRKAPSSGSSADADRARAVRPDVGSVEPGGSAPPRERGASGFSPPVALPAAVASSSPRLPAPSRSRTLLPGETPPGAVRRPVPPGTKTAAGVFVAPDGTRIELGGIVFSEANPVALLNGRVLPVGGVVGGMTVVAIEENRVELEGEGTRVFLSLR